MIPYSLCCLREQFREGELSAAEIVEFFLKRIEEQDSQVGAFLKIFHDRARMQAKALDKKHALGHPLGKLAGVPIALKDNIHVKGEITTCGSKFLTTYRAPFNATVTRFLEEEDAIILGKTNMDEFAMGSFTENSAFQKTANPWNLSCTPGGSSGGSAAAVAARFSPVALGSDTGGSIRQPAALCGVVGFKPTYGRVSRAGLVAFASSLDHIGPLATSVEDIAAVMEVIGRHCSSDSTSLQIAQQEYVKALNGMEKGMRIGVPWSFLDHLQEEPRHVFQRSLETLKQLGAEIVEIDLELLRYSVAVYSILAAAEASTNLARFDGIKYGVRSAKAVTLDEVYEWSKEEGFGPEVKRRILLGTFVLSSGHQDSYYKKAQKVRTLIIQKYQEAFRKCDLVATPTVPSAALPLGSIQDPLQMYLEDIYTTSVNLAGLPAISVPSGFTKEGKPVGLHLIGAQLSDLLVLQAAHVFEKATCYTQQLPPLFK